MSHAEAIIGIPGLVVEHVERKKGIAVWAKPSERPSCKYCQNDQLTIKATYQRKVKHTRQGNQIMMLHLRVPKYYCKACKRYFRHCFTGIRPRYRASEAYRLEVFEAHDGGVTQRKLSKTHNISPSTVERWYHHHVSLKHSEMKRRACPRILGIDEHFFSRRKGFATTFVDLRNHKVFDIKLGRFALSLKPYLQSLEERDKVKVMVMDLSDTYRSIAKQHFPNAIIVADRFHVVRLINHHFLKLWSQHDEIGRKNRGLISLMRRHEWNLREEQRVNLMSYLSNYPVLKMLYHIKQKLMRFILLKAINAKKAKEKLPPFLALIDQLHNSPLRTLAKTLTRWLEPIVAMWRFSKSNGITEGFHNKMEMMSRRAYGFRNFENYRLRVLTHCGWDGIINRTPMGAYPPLIG